MKILTANIKFIKNIQWFEYSLFSVSETCSKAIHNCERSHVSINVKVCVCYFLSNFYFSPNDTLQKLQKMLFISSKCFFHSGDVKIFVFPSSPLFLPVSHCFRGWSKINLKVYDVINCLNKNLITHFVWYLKKEKRHDIETLSNDRVLNKEHFY